MPFSLLEGAFIGIGLFLLGMRFMSDGIRTVADSRIRTVFFAITANRFYSLLLGIILSLSLNSAAAAAIITIGFVNGGLLSVFQALCVMGGCIFGASLALYMPSVPYSLLAVPLIPSGVLFKFFSHRRRISNLGDLLLGAGLLFLGLALMEGNFAPADNHPFYTVFDGLFFNSRLPALFFGALISSFVQSMLAFSSAVNSLMLIHNFGLDIASAMMLGGAIGVAGLTLLASIGGTSAARRAAISLFLIVMGVVLPLLLFIPFLQQPDHLVRLQLFFKGLPDGAGAYQGQLSWINAFCGFLIALACLSLSGLISRRAALFDDQGGKLGGTPQPCAGYLDRRILNTPLLAIEQSRKEIVHMVSVAAFMFADAREIFFDYDVRRIETARQHEQVLDSLNHEITVFLAELAQSKPNASVVFEIPIMLQHVADLEHIGDCCEDLIDCIVAKKERDIFFSDHAMADLKRIAEVAASCLSAVEAMLKDGQEIRERDYYASKDAARAVFKEVKQIHYERISSGSCTSGSAMLFNDLELAFMRICELCWNMILIQGRNRK